MLMPKAWRGHGYRAQQPLVGSPRARRRGSMRNCCDRQACTEKPSKEFEIDEHYSGCRSAGGVSVSTVSNVLNGRRGACGRKP